MVKSLPATQETRFQSLGREDPLEKEMATHSGIWPGESHAQRSLAGYNPWDCQGSDTTEQPSLTQPGLQGSHPKAGPSSVLYLLVPTPRRSLPWQSERAFLLLLFLSTFTCNFPRLYSPPFCANCPKSTQPWRPARHAHLLKTFTTTPAPHQVLSSPLYWPLHY